MSGKRRRKIAGADKRRGENGAVRLDKFLSVTATATRSETKRAVRAGEVLVNGIAAADPAADVDENTAHVVFRGVPVAYRRHHYILLNKPAGFVSATEPEKNAPGVLSLLPEKYTSLGLFPCGRLDKDTVGLLLLTDDGETAHRLLAPRRHVEKRYRFSVEQPLTGREKAAFLAGVTLSDGTVTAPADIEPDDTGQGGVITLTEGKYHQIKRMMGALGNRITFLERVSFGPLTLPPDLPRGAWRPLTEAEEKALLDAAGN